MATVDRSSSARKPALRWCPVRALAPRHRPRIVAHLLGLDANDRHLRFGYAATDGHIARYVDQLEFERDEVFGVFNRRLELVAMTHLAYLERGESALRSAEFGVSVLPRLRGRGLGARLFEVAALHARNRGVDTLIVHALAENAAMLRIARSAGALLERDGSDATARLRLPPENLASHFEELVATQAAEMDYTLKRQVRQIDNVVQSVCALIPGDAPGNR